MSLEKCSDFMLIGSTRHSDLNIENLSQLKSYELYFSLFTIDKPHEYFEIGPVENYNKPGVPDKFIKVFLKDVKINDHYVGPKNQSTYKLSLKELKRDGDKIRVEGLLEKLINIHLSKFGIDYSGYKLVGYVSQIDKGFPLVEVKGNDVLNYL